MTRFLITGALPYSNGRLHVGHIAGAYLPADIYARFQRLRGHEVRFICGSDDNGVAALKTARELGRPVEETSAEFRNFQHKAFEGLGIEFDVYPGTHSFETIDPQDESSEQVYKVHERISQDFFKRIVENGYFEKKTTKQLYDSQAEQFLPDRFVKGTCPHCGNTDANAGQCEACNELIDQSELINPVSVLSNTTPELRDTVHWWLNLQDLSPVLKRWLDYRRRKDAKLSVSHDKLPWRNYVLNSAGSFTDSLKPRSMTRDLTWGVPVPIDDPDAEGKSLYVWFDAPIGYVTFSAVDGLRRGKDLDDYKNWWWKKDTKICHFIGEDNIVFHAVTWPAVILASRGTAEELKNLDPNDLDEEGYQLPEVVVANAYLYFELPSGEAVKNSKSRGHGVFIDNYLQILEADPLRYYLTAIAPEGGKTTFSWKDFIARNNSELVAALGNFVNRYQKILTKHFDRKVPEKADFEEISTEFLAGREKALTEIAACLENYEFKAGLERVMQFARDCNGYIDKREPWNRVNVKKELPGKAVGEVDLKHAGETIYCCIQATKLLALALAPFLPFSSDKLKTLCQLTDAEWHWDKAAEDLESGRELGDAPLLFKKLDESKIFTD